MKNKYNISDSLLKQYSDEDEFIDFNITEKELEHHRVYLPKTPPYNEIDGFGKKPEDQYYIHPKMPAKLIALEEEQDDKGNYLSQDEIHERLNVERDYYKDEIAFIRREWKRRLEGYWFFNKGKATFMDGWHYLYCGYWNLPEGLPAYRNRDRKFFIFARDCDYDPDCYGFVYPKHRREGATHKASCINYAIISITNRARGGIQSMNDESAQDVFQKHIVPAWREMRFWFKPNASISDDPKKVLKFSSASTKGLLGSKKRSKKSLGSEIDYRASGEKAYDGTRLTFVHQDEIGKTKEVDINARWRTIKLCLSTGAGSNIHGLSCLTSTVGEVSAGGGKNMKKLCDNSLKKITGLRILFMPAWECLSGFVGKYGESIHETPTEQQLKDAPDFIIINGKSTPNPIKKGIGAKQFIEDQIKKLKSSGDDDELLNFTIEHPTEYRNCFKTKDAKSFFNVIKIEERLDELAEMRTAVVKGNFEWTGQKFSSKVRFVPDPENGRFNISKILSEAESNRIVWDAHIGSWIALNPHYCSGADPYKANDTRDKKSASLGGAAVFWGQQNNIDDFEKPLHEWITSRFICTYLYRHPDKDDYHEDVLMMTIWFGSPIYIETNVPDLREFFVRKKYGGMLVHNFNVEKETFDPISGNATSATTRQQIFKELQSYINKHVMRERHADLLEQIREIKAVEDMNDYDLFTAAGYALIGISQYINDIQMVDKPQETQTFSQPLFPTFNYGTN